jgi:hypothetical protein
MKPVPPRRERRGLENGTKDHRCWTGRGGPRARWGCSHRPDRFGAGRTGPGRHAVRRTRVHRGSGRIARCEHRCDRSGSSAATERGRIEPAAGSSRPSSARARATPARRAERVAEPARGTAGAGMWRSDATSASPASSAPAASTPTPAATPTTSASSAPAAGRVARNRVAVRSSAAGATRFGRRAVSASTERRRGFGSRPGPP